MLIWRKYFSIRFSKYFFLFHLSHLRKPFWNLSERGNENAAWILCMSPIVSLNWTSWLVCYSPLDDWTAFFTKNCDRDQYVVLRICAYEQRNGKNNHWENVKKCLLDITYLIFIQMKAILLPIFSHFISDNTISGRSKLTNIMFFLKAFPRLIFHSPPSSIPVYPNP